MSAKKAESMNDDKRLSVTVTANPNDGVEGMKTKKQTRFHLAMTGARGV
jgi:hypothetical protein